MEDTPPDDGAVRKKPKTTSRLQQERRYTSNHNISNEQSVNHQSQQPMSKLAPLILQGAQLDRYDLNKIIKTHLPTVRLTDIQCNKNGTITMFAADVKSFNDILLELPKQKFGNATNVKVFIPRTIQRVMDTEKQAFLKNVDVRITTDEIEQALTSVGLLVEKVERLKNHTKQHDGTTVKVTFADVFNRNTIVRTGLQIDHMFIATEAARFATKPVQCFICLGYGHISKYCRDKQQICSRCAGSHDVKNCTEADTNIQCKNCSGHHHATDSKCPKYQEQMKKLKTTVDDYSTNTSNKHRSPPNLTDLHAFPSLDGARQQNSSSSSLNKDNLVEEVFRKVMSKIEPVLNRILDRLDGLDSKLSTLSSSLSIPSTKAQFTKNPHEYHDVDFETEDEYINQDGAEDEGCKSFEMKEVFTSTTTGKKDISTSQYFRKPGATAYYAAATTTTTSKTQAPAYPFPQKSYQRNPCSLKRVSVSRYNPRLQKTIQNSLNQMIN
ncbi:unnamed protein product [Didymodactylos carnosus]|uniref:Gag-like protein n=1 Tax=Didymodactylos carnosus TaxID=1234261 RepID=A0A8S2LQY7_9BILA|nr:unnamed protein product [Didymodactylos carnosus]CAF3917174.1 unnamed protein product [Didymodactylos carnosus]